MQVLERYLESRVIRFPAAAKRPSLPRRGIGRLADGGRRCSWVRMAHSSTRSVLQPATYCPPTATKPTAGDELDAALEVVADFTDLRSSYRAGHSRAVADLAARAVSVAGLTDTDTTLLRRAALLHDIGLHGVPTPILDKPES